MSDRLDPANWGIAWDELAIAGIALGVAIILTLALHALAFVLLVRLSRQTATRADTMLVERLRWPTRWLGIAIAIGLVARRNALVAEPWDALARFVVPAILGWLVLSVVRGFAAAASQRIDEMDDPVALRGRRTKIALFSRTLSFAIIVVTIGLVLLGIPGVREVGVTMVASAGLAALAIGAAAQPALKSLIAGLQMALTEPIRIGDLVVVDGHTGRVEEIRMSFVLVRTWDERLAVVPTVRFLDTTFENWSRSNERLTGPVFFHLDPAARIEPIRAELERWAAAHPLWDRRVARVVMSDTHAESLTLRVAVSANTIGDLFQLCWDLREHMLAWLREHQPDALIRRRLEVDAANARAQADG